MKILLVIAVVLFMSYILIRAADLVVGSINRINETTKLGSYAISSIILALGTSLPEFFVGITSALEENPTISLGTVTGSNIANIALVGGIATLIHGTIRIRKSVSGKDIAFAVLAGLMPALLFFDGSLSRVDGLILISIYLAYATSFFKTQFKKVAAEEAEAIHVDEEIKSRYVRKIKKRSNGYWGRLFLGIALLLFSADIIVRLTLFLSDELSIPKFVIGMVLLAIGTSLPELAFSIRSLEKKENRMFMGNLLGSTITNSTLILGIVAMISPIHLVSVGKYTNAVVVFIVVYLTFWFFVRTKHRLDRWEAGVMIAIFLLFLAMQLY